MKKFVSITLSLVMVASLLCGCGGNKTSDVNSDKEANQATATAEPTKAAENTPKAETNPDQNAEPCEITLGIWPNTSLADDVTLFESYSARFKETHPNVTVVPASYTYATDTFIPMCEAGNCPTIFDTWFTEPKKIIAQGYAKDITDILERKGWLDQMTPAVRELLSDGNGRVYGVPRNGYALGLMLNVDLFKEAGLVDADGYPLYPTSWEDLAQKAKTIKDATGAAGLCLLAADKGGGWHFSNIAWSFGASFTQYDAATNKYTATVDSQEAINAMQYVKDLKWKYDVLTDDPLSEDWAGGFEAIATDTAAMYIAANDAINQPTQVFGMNIDNLAMCGLPAGPAGQVTLVGGTPYMFNANATDEQVEACLDYLEVMGNCPFINDITLQGLKATYENNIANGVPVIKGFQCWSGEEYLHAIDELVDRYKNVDSKKYDNYTDVTTNGNLSGEEVGDAQQLYQQLNNVIQEVLTNENADIPTLMKTADENYQQALDEEYGQK